MKRRLLVAVPFLAATVLLLSGCGVANVISPPYTSAIYATVADAAGAAESVSVPSWVPADATYVRIKTAETTKASILMFTPGPTPPTFTACDPASDPDIDQSKSTGGLTAELDETWWPRQLNEGVVVVCTGKWHLFGQDGGYYAWTP